MAGDFKKLMVWQKADDLAVQVYSLTKDFPREEMYGVTAQLRRAAYSVPSNIAEGSKRGSQKDFLHFLNISEASLAEVEYFLHLAKRLGYLKGDGYESGESLRQEVARLLHGLIRKIGSDSRST